MGPLKFGAPGNCPICPPLKPALIAGHCIRHKEEAAHNIYAYLYISSHTSRGGPPPEIVLKRIKANKVQCKSIPASRPNTNSITRQTLTVLPFQGHTFLTSLLFIYNKLHYNVLIII